MHGIARIACLTLALGFPAQAQDGQTNDAQANPGGRERVEIDTNLFCDTQQQVERFLSLLDEKQGSAEAAIAGVNEENNTQDACVIATAAYRRLGTASTVKNGEATFEVMRIVILGVYTVKGLERALPTEFFTLMPRDADHGTVGQGQQ